MPTSHHTSARTASSAAPARPPDTGGDGAPLGSRELALVALLACALSVAMHWPLAAHLGRDIPRDLGDPLVQAWEVAWGGHALLHKPLDFFQADTFWPLRNSLAFSDALVGYAPAGAIGQGAEAALVRYNLLFLFAYALAFAGAYLLARELRVGPGAAAAAGAAFAYAPWRLEQDGHLHVLSSGGIPLSLFLLLRGYRRDAWGMVLAGWLVATWQLSLGFTLGLQLAYLLATLGAITAIVHVRRRPGLRRPVLVATVAGIAVFAGSAALLARPYMQVADDHPEAKRTPAQVAGLSPPPLKAFVAAPEENLLWGGATAGVRDDLSSVPEQTLFPGVAIVALAALGLAAGVYPRRLRAALGVALAASVVLLLGFPEHGSALLHPYRLLYDYVPGWKGIRVPGRLMTLASLALALLAAAGAQRLAACVRGRLDARRRGRAWQCIVGVALVGVILAEGAGFGLGRGAAIAGPSHPRVPSAPAGAFDAPEPQLHLPPTIAANRRYVMWSADGFPKLVNGRGSFDPRSFEQLVEAVRRFPDDRSVARLRSLGVRAVVLHTDLAAGTAWEHAGERPIARLALRRAPRGPLVVYQIAPR
jgi:hypothetical protein